jgi:hypothetical protein
MTPSTLQPDYGVGLGMYFDVSIRQGKEPIHRNSHAAEPKWISRSIQAAFLRRTTTRQAASKPRTREKTSMTTRWRNRLCAFSAACGVQSCCRSWRAPTWLAPWYSASWWVSQSHPSLAWMDSVGPPPSVLSGFSTPRGRPATAPAGARAAKSQCRYGTSAAWPASPVYGQDARDFITGHSRRPGLLKKARQV